MAKVNEMKNKVKNRALSDSDMAMATGGNGGSDTTPKYNVGDRVHVSGLEDLGIGEIVSIDEWYGNYFYTIRFETGTYEFPEEELY
ncbi:MAG: hypothetical protein E7308_11190 [Butyrivibrio sp.]|nr:hypothetical protein [Butyrivibrio sp.]